MTLKVTNLSSGNIVVLEPKGSLIGGDETDEVKKTIINFLKEGNKKLIVDLAGVDYLNSTALGVFVAAHTSYAKAGGKIKLCNVNKNIQNIFIITKLTLVFEVYETQKEAIASFAA